MKTRVRRNGHWLVLLLATDLTCVALTWVLRPDAIRYVALFLALFTALTVLAGWLLDARLRRKRLQAAKKLLLDPTEQNKEALFALIDDAYRPLLDTLIFQLRQQTDERNEMQLELQSYQQYIEEWTHEIKTPLSLMMLVLENHAGEMSAYTAERMRFATGRIAQDVQRMLFYARLQAEHSDYRFVPLGLDECARQALAEFAPLAAERNVKLVTQLAPVTAVSDEKVLLFILSQLLSNAIKYANRRAPEVLVRTWCDDGGSYLGIYDNGSGVPPEDVPFLFDKGFTGSHPDRQKATGMGLYLVGRYAKALSVTVQPQTELPQGFGMLLTFPLVDTTCE